MYKWDCMYKWGLFVLVILLSFSIVYGQSCGDNQCESSSITLNFGEQVNVTDINGQSKTLILTNVQNTDTATIKVGNFIDNLTTGKMTIIDGVAVTLDNVIYNAQNPSTSKVELSVGENLLSCQQDCKFIGRILSGEASPHALASKISCDDNTCYILYLNSLYNGDLYFSILDLQTGNFRIRDQKLPSTGTTIGSGVFDIIVGNSEALAVWIENNQVKAAKISPQGIVNFVSPSFNSPCLSGCISEDTTSFKSNPKAAWDSKLNRYLVSWEQCQGNCFTDKDIWATFIANGQDYTDGYLLNSPGVSTGFDFIYVPTSQSYLGIWEENGVLKSGAWDRNARASSFIFGPPPSDLLEINLPSSQFGPVIAQGATDFLTVFNDIRAGQFDVYGQLLQTVTSILPITNPPPPKITDVQISGFDFIISTQPETESVRNVEYNPDYDEYVVVGNLVSSQPKIFLTRLDKDGNILGSRVLERYRSPDIQWVSSLGKYVLTAEDVRNQQANEPLKVYSIFLERDLSTSTSQGVTVIPTPTSKYIAPTSQTMAGYNTQITDLSRSTRTLNDGDKINYIPPSQSNPLGSQYFILFNHTTYGPRATFLTDASKDIDLSSLKIESSSTATAIDDTGIDRTVVEKFSLHIPNTSIGLDIRVCPNATTLSQIVPGCSNEAIFRNVNHTLQNQTVNGIVMGAMFGLDNLSYVVFAPGTGAEIIGSETSSLTIDHEKNKKANESVTFTANYKDGSGNPIQNATCNITFKVNPIGSSTKGPFNMTFNSSSNLYQYNTSFNKVTSEYEVTCSAPGYPSQTKKKSFTILAAGTDAKPTVTLTKPTVTTVTNTNRPVIECTATDDKKLTSIDIYTDFDGTWKMTDTKTLNSTSGSISYQPFQNLTNGNYIVGCAATDDKHQKTFSANKTLTINFSPPKPPCSITDFAKGPWSNPKDQCGTRTVTLQNQNCDPNHPNSRKPAETKSCPQTRDCVDDDYRKGAWGACVDGKQTRTLILKSDAQCDGQEQKSETRSCQAGFPWLFVIIAVVVVIGVVLGILFFLHKKGKPSEEEYDSDEYGDEDSLPEGEDKSDEDTLWDKSKK